MSYGAGSDPSVEMYTSGTRGSWFGRHNDILVVCPVPSVPQSWKEAGKLKKKFLRIILGLLSPIGYGSY